MYGIENILLSLILSLFFIVSFYIIFKHDASGIEKIQLIFTILGSLTTLLVIYNIYLSIKYNEKSEDNQHTQHSIDNNKQSFVNPLEKIVTQYPESFELYQSMTPSIEGMSITPIVDQEKKVVIETLLSTIVFQSISDYILLSSHSQDRRQRWTILYMTWLRSPILRKEWVKTKQYYMPKTIKIIERLIDYSKNIQPKIFTYSDYERLALAFLDEKIL